jgi:peroxiredoxin
MAQNKFTAGDAFPAISLKTINDGEVEIGKPLDERDWHMVIVYRGKHCPMCTGYLKQLESIKDKYYENGISILAVSADPKEKASSHLEETELSFPVAYGLTIKQMTTLGLYISHPRSAQETEIPFAEPGIFIINEKGQVQVTDISNAPFARPELELFAMGLKFIRDPANNYPIRGTYTL